MTGEDERCGQGSSVECEGPLVRLPRRQFQVATLVGRGLSNKDIAVALGISPKTVQHTLTAVYTKLRLGSRYHLVRAVLEGAVAPLEPNAPGSEPHRYREGRYS